MRNKLFGMSGGRRRSHSGFGLFSSGRSRRGSGGGIKNVIGFGNSLFKMGKGVVGVGGKFAVIINNRLDKRKEMMNHNKDGQRELTEHEKFKKVYNGQGIHRDAQ